MKMELSKLRSYWKGGVYGVLIAFAIYLTLNLFDLFSSLPQGCEASFFKTAYEGTSVRNCFRNGAISFFFFIPLYIMGFFIGAFIGKKMKGKSK